MKKKEIRTCEFAHVVSQFQTRRLTRSKFPTKTAKLITHFLAKAAQKLPCSLEFLRDFYFEDWRFF